MQWRAVALASGSVLVLACAAVREGPLSQATPSTDADAPPDGADGGGPSDLDGGAGGADADAAYDLEWAMWRLPAEAPAAGDYSVAASVARDEVTGLEWMREPLGRMAHGEAMSACASSPLAGGGFRLPTHIELLGLVDYAPRGSGINESVFAEAGASDDFWSASVDALAPSSRAWFVSFSRGTSGTDVASGTKAVRCVRGGTL